MLMTTILRSTDIKICSESSALVNISHRITYRTYMMSSAHVGTKTLNYYSLGMKKGKVVQFKLCISSVRHMNTLCRNDPENAQKQEKTNG